MELTPYRVAKDCHFDQTVFTQWKKGRQQPSIEILNKLANYFNVSVDYLLGREEKLAKQQTAGQNPAADVTAAPILQIWAELDEVQRAKALRYCETLIAKDNRPKGVISEQ